MIIYCKKMHNHEIIKLHEPKVDLSHNRLKIDVSIFMKRKREMWSSI